MNYFCVFYFLNSFEPNGWMNSNTMGKFPILCYYAACPLNQASPKNFLAKLILSTWNSSSYCGSRVSDPKCICTLYFKYILNIFLLVKKFYKIFVVHIHNLCIPKVVSQKKIFFVAYVKRKFQC